MVNVVPNLCDAPLILNLIGGDIRFTLEREREVGGI